MSVIGPRPQLVRDLVFMSKEERKRHPPDISYEQPQFYADRVREELLDWNDSVGLAVRDGENKTRIVKAKGSLKESARSMRIWL